MQTSAQVLLFIGVAVIVASSWAALWLRGVLVRLHYLSPVTTIGAPLIGVSLLLANGWGLSTGLILLTVSLLAGTGPAIAVAMARVMAQREGITPSESPE
ncbi:MAG TPA: monovalent cation/H(+) antiporter subunit G [Acidothermaceae bacterium]|jgi:multicomponent Na+:H+ antiporter subunit G